MTPPLILLKTIMRAPSLCETQSDKISVCKTSYHSSLIGNQTEIMIKTIISIDMYSSFKSYFVFHYLTANVFHLNCNSHDDTNFIFHSWTLLIYYSWSWGRRYLKSLIYIYLYIAYCQFMSTGIYSLESVENHVISIHRMVREYMIRRIFVECNKEV